MSDSEHRRSPDGRDDDAIFADIVAHLKESAPEPERAAPHGGEETSTDHVTAPGTTGEARPRTVHETTGQTTDETTNQTDETTNQTDETTGQTDQTTAQTTGRPQGDPQPLPTPQVWRAHEVDDDEEHFEPPPVTPLPVGDLQFWAILAGMGGGPLLLVYLVFFNRGVSSYWTLVAIAMSVGGFALLVSRLPGQDDNDDGARL